MPTRTCLTFIIPGNHHKEPKKGRLYEVEIVINLEPYKPDTQADPAGTWPCAELRQVVDAAARTGLKLGRFRV